MATISVSAIDVTNAENFLEQFLTDSIPDGDFTKGTALRDLTVGAIAAIYAFLKSENDKVKARQSLLTIQAGVSDGDTESLNDAVTAYLSNWFVNRKGGTPARGTVTGHISQKTNIFISTFHRFSRTDDLVYSVDSTETFVVLDSDLNAIIDASGNVIEYQFTFPVVAIANGEQYNVDPGSFTKFDTFNPFVTRIENLDKFSGGKGTETITEVLDRAPTAISVRNLINEKSIAATLHDNFSEIKGITVAGFGDPEMQRDVLTNVAGHLALHIGGATDVYLTLDTIDTVFTGVVGSSFKRPDGISNIFRDLTIADPFDAASITYPQFPVQVGDVINITAGLPSVPRQFSIVEVHPSELITSERVPFPLATDETVTPFVSYTIGRSGFPFNDVLAGTGGAVLITGRTSRTVIESGRITLPGGPVMEITDIVVTNPDIGDPLKSPDDGFVHFDVRSNTTPIDVLDPSAVQYQITTHNPLYTQTKNQWMEVIVGTQATPLRWEGKNLRVKYKTLNNFLTIHDFTQNSFERIVNASLLVKGHNPVVLSMTIGYKVKVTATSLPSEIDMSTLVTNFINTFDTSITHIDVSAITQLLRDQFTQLASILPFDITYTLSAPTGDVLTYSTADEVIIENSKQISGPTIDFASMGITARTLRYFTVPSLITFVLTV